MFQQIGSKDYVSNVLQLGRRLVTLGITACCLLQLVVGRQPARAAKVSEKEIWAANRIGEAHAGYYREIETRSNGQIATSITNDIVLNRMGSKVEVKSTSRYEESAEGRLLGIHSVMSSSAQSTTTDATVKGNTLLVHTSTGGKTYDRTLPFTGEILGPAAARQLTISRLKSSGDSVSYQMFIPELGAVTTISNTLVGADSVAVQGVPEQAMKIEQTNSAMPEKCQVWLDGQGWILRQLTPSPFGDLETLRTSAQEAQQTAGNGAAFPQEIFSGTLVKSNVQLPEERLIEQLTIRITHKKPGLGWPDFTADNQKVLEKTPDHVVLAVWRMSPKNDSQRPVVTSDPGILPYLEPNALLQSDDSAVRSIAAKIAGNDTSAFRSARSLQEWTNQNMRFDLGVAIAPASEVVRNRRGTCFGYAVLLASLARAEGIPSRIRMGFVYAGGIWGGHAWVDVLIAGHWISLDGALYSPGPADAARFSFFSSSLQEGTISKVGELAKLYGNVDIEVLDYTIHGKRIVVPSDAKPSTISGDVYSNPWLGLTVQKPSSFHFTQVDTTWPDSTVVAMEGPQQQVVEIQSHSSSLPVNEKSGEEELLRDSKLTGARSQQEVNGQSVTMVSSPEAAGLVLKQGGDLFVMRATGPDAAQRLMQVASTVRLEK